MFKTFAKTLLMGSLVFGVMGIGMFGTGPRHAQASSNYYHTSGNQIVDSAGNPAVFNGINWFGFETANYSPHGLWS
jgi:endoglucanase